MKNSKLMFCLLAAFTMGLAACGGEKKPEPGPVDPPVVDESVKFSATTLDMVKKDVAKLVVSSESTSKITLSASNVNVKLSKTEVNPGEEFEVLARNAGTTVITATNAAGKSATCTVTIVADGVHTYRYALTTSPSNWNELTYQDNNDTEILGYLGGSFFSFDYQFDAEGKMIPGGYTLQYDAVQELEDVTEEYAGDEKYSVPEEATNGYAYKFTLRDDLKWDDGTPIHAEDFVYTMQQQEDPLFKNYRADSFYTGDTVIHNAQNYVKQGDKGIFASKTVFGGIYSEAIDDQLIFDGFYGDGGEKDEASYFFEFFRDWYDADATDDANLKKYGIAYAMYGFGMIGQSDVAEWVANATALDGKTLAEIKADTDLAPIWGELIGAWQTEPGEELDFFITDYTFPAVDFKDVGIFVGDSENELVVVLDKTLNLFKEDGESLAYTAAYNFGSLPLVKRDLYEANKHEPATDDGLWTSTYNSSVETSASWGPYKLTQFQADRSYQLERNDKWYGYNMELYAGQYETDVIHVDIIKEFNTEWLAFQQGDVSVIGIDVSIAEDYRNSSRAVFTASDFVGSLQLQSSASALKDRETEGVDKEMLTYVEFRKAISLGIDRAEYVQRCTTSSLPGFGLFNSMHYYDVENAGVYRNEDVAKQVLCEVYGVDVSKFDSLDEAYATITGLNMELAKQLIDEAYAKALAAETISATDKVVLTVGASEDNEATRRQFNFLNDSMKELAKGTQLEGRFELDFNASFGSKWANDFRAGAYDICTGGWTGAAWNPGYFLLAYLDPAYMYSRAWDTAHEMLEFNPWGDDVEEHTLNMSLLDWYYCLNGKAGYPYNWSRGEVADSFRLGIIAALEKAILTNYYTVPLQYRFSAGLISYQIEYYSRDYNTFMGYGGVRYMTYNYNDAEWAEVKAGFDYKD